MSAHAHSSRPADTARKFRPIEQNRWDSGADGTVRKGENQSRSGILVPVSGSILPAGVSKGIAAISRESGVPLSFDVLTTDTVDQAIDRAGTKAGNKGLDAAQGALEMVKLPGRMA